MKKLYLSIIALAALSLTTIANAAPAAVKTATTVRKEVSTGGSAPLETIPGEVAGEVAGEVDKN